MILPATRVVVVFRNDDLAGASDLEHEKRLATIFESHNVPQTLGVIPFCATDSYRDPRGEAHVLLDDRPAIVEFLKAYVARSGSEIALHGFRHRTNRRSRPAKREFFEFRAIGYEEQHDLIRKGTEIVERCLSVRPRTFIPPWNRLDADTVRACADLGYEIVSAGPFTEVPPGLASLGTDCDLESFAPRFDAALTCGRRVFLRIMFHSRTVTSPEQIRLLERAVRLAAETPGCEALTLAEVVRRYPGEVATLNEAGRNIVPQDQVPGTVRSRSVVYQRFARAVGRPRKVLAAFLAAREAYSRGDYAGAAGLTTTLDLLCALLVARGRAIVLAGGSLLGLLLAWVTAITGAGRTTVYPAAAIGVALAGALAVWQGTSPDTRREIRLLGVSLLISGAIGVGVGHWFGFGRPSTAGVARSAVGPSTR